MKTQRGMVVLLVLLIAGLTLFMLTQKPPGQERDLGPAPDVSLVLEPEGKIVQLSSLKGHVVVLDFWATWCGPCKMSIPEVEQMYEQNRDKGLMVIGVSTDDPGTQPQIPAVQKALGMTYPIMLASKSLDIVDKYQAPSIPVMYVIDKKGTIRKVQEGLDRRKGLADVRELVENLLAE